MDIWPCSSHWGRTVWWQEGVVEENYLLMPDREQKQRQQLAKAGQTPVPTHSDHLPPLARLHLPMFPEPPKKAPPLNTWAFGGQVLIKWQHVCGSQTHTGRVPAVRCLEPHAVKSANKGNRYRYLRSQFLPCPCLDFHINHKTTPSPWLVRVTF